MQPLQIKIFTLGTCSHCKSTKRLLGEFGVQYEFTDVDLLHGEERASVLDNMKKFNPRASFPTIIIGEKVIVGYKEEEIRDALSF